MIFDLVSMSGGTRYFYKDGIQYSPVAVGYNNGTGNIMPKVTNDGVHLQYWFQPTSGTDSDVIWSIRNINLTPYKTIRLTIDEANISDFFGSTHPLELQITPGTSYHDCEYGTDIKDVELKGSFSEPRVFELDVSDLIGVYNVRVYGSSAKANTGSQFRMKISEFAAI